MITQDIINFNILNYQNPKSMIINYFNFNNSNYLKYLKIANDKRQLNKLEDQLLDQENIKFHMMI